jgi:hypothetical protein
MSPVRWTLLVLLICLPVAVLATGIPLPFLDAPDAGTRPVPVADGDLELAWLNTSTNWTAWERFVSGVSRAPAAVPGLTVDGRRAFRDQSTEVPELVLTVAGRPGRIRIRWYKLSSDATAGEWVKALAGRSPAPVAVIGGGSSDRAADLATALNQQTAWAGGDRPLLLLTTASADDLTAAGGPTLLDLYPGRTFRFCFSNRQMAEALHDFVWDHPDLRPQLFAATAPLAVASGLAARGWRAAERSVPAFLRPHIFTVSWLDDPFSRDLNDRFRAVLAGKLRSRSDADPGELPVRFTAEEVPFSVGGFTRPNDFEARVAAKLAAEIRALPPQRSLIVLPAAAAPARRLLRAVADGVPDPEHRLVAVTGDGVSLNAVYRDGEFAWPVQAVPVPLVMFAHNNPVGWDDRDLIPPTATDDVLHYAEMGRLLAEGLFGLQACEPGPPATRADDLAARLRGRCPGYFDDKGNRVGGTGEYVVVVRPRPAAEPVARLDVWRRTDARLWESVRTLTIDQWHARTGAGE